MTTMRTTATCTHELPSASDQLKALAAASSIRSKMARLKDLMPDIDHAMQSGVPRSEILGVLSASGLEISLNYFDVARRRIKKSQLPKAADLNSGRSGGISSNVQTVSSTASRPNKDDLSAVAKNSAPEKIEADKSNKSTDNSVRGFRNQFVDLNALAKLAPKN